MPRLTPIKASIRRPRMAMAAEPEKLAYVAMLNPDPQKPDALAVVDLDPASSSYGQLDRPGGHARHRRRAASLRLERVQLVPVPVLAAPAHGAALPGGAGHALVAHPHPRHQARSAQAAAREGHRGRRGDEAHRLQPPAHGALRSRRHLPERARLCRRQRPGRHLHPRPRDVRHPRAAGNRIADRSTSRTTSGGISATTR